MLAIYVNLPVVRHEHHSGLPRLLELLDRFSPYEAPYVALAECLDATLVTCDGRLTRGVQKHLALNVVGVTG